jgi:hypothetical protein
MLIEEVAYIFCCVVHAFIYAEPKKILRNQSSFWLNQLDSGCPVWVLNLKLMHSFNTKGVENECFEYIEVCQRKASTKCATNRSSSQQAQQPVA